MTSGGSVGASLGVKIAQIATKVREDSLGRTTPALVKLVGDVAEAEGRRRAQAMSDHLTGWLESHASDSPIPAGIGSLLKGLLGPGSFLGNYVIGNAIGFGVGTALAATLTPWFNDMTQAAWRANPSNILSPAELALAVLKGNLDQGSAEAEAMSSGVTPERFQVLFDNTGEPLGPADLLSLWRRNLIDDARLEHGVRQSRVRNEWLDALKMLAVVPMAPEEALQALLEGQTDEAEARELYRQGGGNPDQFELRFNTRGEAPTPTQALDLLNRGIIAERGSGPEALTYEQAFLEGPWRNKWLDSFLALRQYLLPVRSILPVYKAGAITAARAMELYAANGVSPEDARALLDEATAGKLAPERDLVKSEVLAAYREGLQGQPQAAESLAALGYSAEEADLILAIEDHGWESSYRKAALGRIRSLYVGAKVTEEEAASAMEELGVAGPAQAKMLALWDVERTLPRADLTEAQVRAAWKAAVVDEGYYRGWLTDHGYSTAEADILVKLYQPK